ncbi:MAG: endonuclease/exonuclease/phosphatase family protein [Planctomycetia bacterium]|nr:endonuclease/exonuclease/phosphatase family protein [Planctomycetia bacterium]
MNRRDAIKGLYGLGALVVTATPYALAETHAPLKLRILSYNIQIGRGPGGSYSDPTQAHLDRTAARIADAKPDVVGLQEVDNKTGRSGTDVDQLGVIAELTGFIPTFVAKKEQNGGVYGVGVLSKEKPVSVAHAFIKGSAHRRVLEICEFQRYYFFNTHLPLTEELRVAAVDIINAEAAKRLDKPIILLGDLNAEPDSPEIKKLQETWTQISPNAPTFPADDPKVQIDYIFLKNVKKFNLLEASVIDDSTTSDHRPVLCEVEIF